MKLRLSSLWQRATGRRSQRESLAETEPPERRADLPSSPAAMSWVGEAGNSNYLEVELSERSPQGLGVSSPRPIPVDQKVWLILPGGDDYQGLVDGHCHVNRVEPQRPAWIPFQAAALAVSHTLNASFRNRLNVSLLHK